MGCITIDYYFVGECWLELWAVLLLAGVVYYCLGLNGIIIVLVNQGLVRLITLENGRSTLLCCWLCR